MNRVATRPERSVPTARHEPSDHERPKRAGDLWEMGKPRITALVLVTTAVGYLLASTEGIDGLGLAIVLAGTALASAGAGALNHALEAEADARMRRTWNRPVATGRVSRRAAALFGTALATLGIATLALMVNLPTAALGFVTIVLYVAVYTPLKARTALNTLVGAVPGAIPPMMGWTAATGRIEAGAWVLFAILFLWQLPHFLAIAWMYREDYARAGFPMLTVIDPAGASTGRQVALYSVALLPVSLAPTLLGLTGLVYFFGALALGIGFIGFGLALAVGRRRASARRLLLASVAYLPLLLLLLVADRVAG